ncbi:MAG: pilus assembly protein PilM [Candidatus Omnitrophica bacterium]|nr:pilus assembly protein PilM [Candidatus Omnitrophota bacterium]
MLFFKTTVGLYIGPKAVQLAELQAVGKKIQLVNFIHLDIEAEQAGNLDKEELLVTTLRKALNKSKIDPRRVNTVLLPGMVLLRYFQMPRISAEEMEEAVRFEARKYIPFRLEEAVTGFYILKDDHESRKIGILSLVTKEESIKSHLTVLHKVNVSPSSVETASFALLRLLEHNAEIDRQKSNLVLYLYAQRLNIIILKNGIPYFVRDISLAKKEEWIDDEAAEFLMGGKIIPSDNRLITLENMVSELKISLKNNKKELGNEEVSKVVLCGELDNFDDLAAVKEVAQAQPDNLCPLGIYIEKQLNVPVHIVDPLKNVIIPKVKPLPYTFPMIAVTVGAGLRNLTKSTVEIDLFSARKKPSLKAKIFVYKLVLGGLAALLLSYLIIFVFFQVFESKEKNLLEQEKRNRPKFMDLSHFSDEQLNTGKTEILQRLDIYNQLVLKRFIVTDKLSIFPETMMEDIWLNSLLFTYITTSDAKSIKKDVILQMEGNVFSSQKGLEVEIVNDFAEALKTNDKFYEGFLVMKFQLTCYSSPSEKEE